MKRIINKSRNQRNKMRAGKNKKKLQGVCFVKLRDGSSNEQLTIFPVRFNKSMISFYK